MVFLVKSNVRMFAAGFIMLLGNCYFYRTKIYLNYIFVVKEISVDILISADMVVFPSICSANASGWICSFRTFQTFSKDSCHIFVQQKRDVHSNSDLSDKASIVSS